MSSQPEPVDTDVPFFPFRIRRHDESGGWATGHHLLGAPVQLNRAAAEVLRLADGKRTLGEIVRDLGNRYADAPREAIRRDTATLLGELGAHDLVWWRTAPLQAEPVGPPQTVFCEITAACNLRCLHCVVQAGNRLPGELPTSRWLELIEELAAFGVSSVAFSGGEPLLHPDFRALADRARGLGLGIQVATNGTLVTPELAAWLRALDADVQVSLDGSRSEIHDRMRPGQEAFKRAVAGVRALVAAGHHVTIGSVLSTINRSDIPDLVRLARDLGATTFRLIPFVPRGRGERFEELEVAPVEVRRLTAELHDLRGRCGIEIAPIELEDYLDGHTCMEPLDPRRGLGCHGAIGYGTITPTGEVQPCHFFDGVRADSVARTRFDEVWRHSRFLAFFRQLTVSDLHGACADCDRLGSCGGGCRAVNFAKGDLLGANPQCWVWQNGNGTHA